MKIVEDDKIVDMVQALEHHEMGKDNLYNNVFRYASPAYLKFLGYVKQQRKIGNYPTIDEYENELLDSDIGEVATFFPSNDETASVIYDVPLDLPLTEEMEMELSATYKGKDVDLNKPKKGGSKKFYVYVKDPETGNVKKIEFGAKDGGNKLSVKLQDPGARKAFADRHDCKNKNDKMTAGYWSCRLPRYAKSLGLKGSGKWWTFVPLILPLFDYSFLYA